MEPGGCFNFILVCLLCFSGWVWCLPDESCRTYDDCMKDGKKCDGLMDAGCICKNGKCKISSGCGTMGAFFFTKCSTCSEDDCEDEGACKWEKGKCKEEEKLDKECHGSVRLSEDKVVTEDTDIKPSMNVTKVLVEGCGCFKLYSRKRGKGRSLFLSKAGEWDVNMKVASVKKVSCFILF